MGSSNPKMRIFLFGISSVFTSTLNHKEASNFLKRQPRVFDDIYLESQADNFERECVEKRCNNEEFDEIYDFETGLIKNSYPQFPIHVTKPCYEFTNGFDNNTLRKALLKECVDNMTSHPEIARRVAFSAAIAPAKSLCKAFRWSSPTNC